MAVMQAQRRCGTCGRKTLHARSYTGAGTGCLLSVVTLGLFLPVWLVMATVEMFRPWRCQQCGGGRLA
jgi:hypothetical protein